MPGIGKGGWCLYDGVEKAPCAWLVDEEVELLGAVVVAGGVERGPHARTDVNKCSVQLQGVVYCLHLGGFTGHLFAMAAAAALGRYWVGYELAGRVTLLKLVYCLLAKRLERKSCLTAS